MDWLWIAGSVTAIVLAALAVAVGRRLLRVLIDRKHQRDFDRQYQRDFDGVWCRHHRQSLASREEQRVDLLADDPDADMKFLDWLIREDAKAVAKYCHNEASA